MIVDEIIKLSSDAFENYVVVTKDNMYEFTYKDNKRLTEFLKRLKTKIEKSIQKREVKIDDITKADDRNPDVIRNRKTSRKVASFIGVVGFVLVSYLVLKLGFSYTYLEHKIISMLSLLPIGLASAQVSNIVYEKLIANESVENLKYQIESLESEKELVESLIKHLTLKAGQKKGNDIFSIANEKKPGFFRKIELRLGSKPKSFAENSFFQLFSARKAEKLAAKMELNKSKQNQIPIDVRSTVNRENCVETVFSSRKLNAFEKANDAQKNYKTKRLAVASSYLKRKKFFESRFFDEALESSEKVDIKTLEAIIENEIKSHPISKRELLAYKSALKQSLSANSELNMYENTPNKARREIRVQLLHLRHLLKQYENLRIQKNKALEGTGSCYIKSFKPKK